MRFNQLAILLLLVVAVFGCTDSLLDIPCKRKGHVAAVTDDKLFVMFGSRHSDEYINDTWVTDLTGTAAPWKQLYFGDSVTPVHRWKSCGVVYQGGIYVYGGHTGIKSDPMKGYLNDIWRFDISEYTWELIMQTDSEYDGNDSDFGGRRAHSCDLIGDYMYVYGGRNLDDVAYTQMIRYSFTNNRFELIPVKDHKSMESELARKGHAAAVINKNSLFIQGGRQDLDYKDDSWSFDTDEEQWKEMTGELSGFQGRNHHTGVFDEGNNEVVLFGGRGGRDDTYFNDLYTYSVASNTWTKHNTWTPSARFLHTADVYGTNMIVFGGEGDDGRNNELWKMDLDSKQWTQVQPKIEL